MQSQHSIILSQRLEALFEEVRNCAGSIKDFPAQDSLSLKCQIEIGDLQFSAGDEIQFSGDPTDSAGRKTGPSMTLHSIIDTYLKFVNSKAKRGRKKPGVRPATAKKNAAALVNFAKRHDLSTYSELVRFIKSYDFEVEREKRKELFTKGPTFHKWNQPLDEFGGFKAMLRCCSGVFRKSFRKYLKKMYGTKIKNPFAEFDTQSETKPYRPHPGGMKFWQELCEKLFAECDPLMIGIFLICYATGIRIQEAAHLMWADLIHDPAYETYYLKVTTGLVHDTKNRKARDIPITKELHDYLISCRPKRAKISNWIIPDEASQRNPDRTVRCCGVSSRLCGWLRSNGVDSPNPIHALRKQYGSAVVHEQSLYVASRLLGHSSIKVTEEVYAAPIQKEAINAPVPQKAVKFAANPKTKASSEKKETKDEIAAKKILSFLKQGPASPKMIQRELNLPKTTFGRARDILEGKELIVGAGCKRSRVYHLE